MSTALANPTEMIQRGAPHLIHSDEELDARPLPLLVAGRRA